MRKEVGIFSFMKTLFWLSCGGSTKAQIKKAFEQLYDQEVARVNTHITSKGVKLAYVKLVEEGEAEDVAVKMGVF